MQKIVATFFLIIATVTTVALSPAVTSILNRLSDTMSVLSNLGGF